MCEFSYKIVMYGDADSIKTELGEPSGMSDDKLTIGAEFFIKKIKIDNTKVLLRIWNLSSEERFKDLIPSFVLGASGAILVIKMQNDILVSELRDKVLNVKNTLSRSILGSIPIVVLGIRDETVVKQPKYSSVNIAIAKNIGAEIFSVCSSTDKLVIEFVFQQLCRILLNKTLVKLVRENRKSSTLPESSLYEGSILLSHIVGFGLVILVIIAVIISLYTAYLRNL